MVERKEDLLRSLRSFGDAIVASIERNGRLPPYMITGAMNVATKLIESGSQEDVANFSGQLDAVSPESLSKHPDQAEYLYFLSSILVSLYQRIGDIETLNRAIDHLQMSVMIGAEERTPLYLDQLGVALKLRFRALGDQEDVQAAVRAHENALSIASGETPFRGMVLDHLTMALRDSFDGKGEAEPWLLDRAVELGEEAVKLLHSVPGEDTIALQNLSNNLLRRYAWTGSRADLDQALANLKQALELETTEYGRAHLLARYAPVTLLAAGPSDENQIKAATCGFLEVANNWKRWPVL